MLRHWIAGLSMATATVAASCIIVGADEPPPYEPCATDAECSFHLECYDVIVDYGDAVAQKRMCTRDCEDDSDCPDEGACSDAANGPMVCYRRCSGDLDCAPGFACVTAVAGRAFEPMCLPRMTPSLTQ